MERHSRIVSVLKQRGTTMPRSSLREARIAKGRYGQRRMSGAATVKSPGVVGSPSTVERTIHRSKNDQRQPVERPSIQLSADDDARLRETLRRQMHSGGKLITQR